MDRIDPNTRDVAAPEATPNAGPVARRPGELAFALLLLVASTALLWSAYGIKNPFGPNGLSAPRAIPMAATAVMVVATLLVVIQTVRLPLDRAERLVKDNLPPVVLIFAVFLVLYGVALRPLGFLPTSALFLIVAIRILGKRGWLWTISVSLGSLIVIWLIFRIVFTVLMPAGVVPEAELIQIVRSLVSGAPQP